MTCPKCKKHLNDNINFCPYCQTKVNEQTTFDPANFKPSQEEIILRKEKKKKILLIAVLVVIGMFLILGILTLAASGINYNIKEQQRRAAEQKTMRSFVYPTPDYGFNIFEDEKYMGLDRNVWVSDGVMRTVIKEDNKTSYSPELQFMYDVINYIINGDYTEYNKIFTESCFEGVSDEMKRLFEKEQFTMQQLFEIELEYLHSREEGSLVYTDIMLTYRIRNNNGTFRNDLDFEDGARPVVYALVSDRGGEIKTEKIMTYSMYLSGLY